MKNSFSLAFIVLVVLSACGSSKITSSAGIKNSGALSFTKILVLSLVNDKDTALGAGMEAHMAADLRESGYEVITAYETYGPNAFNGLTEKQALAMLEKKNVEAVVTIVLFDKKKEKLFVPAKVEQHMISDQNRSFWRYYSTTNARVMEPGYYIDNIEYYWESNLYDVRSQSLLYTSRTTTFNPVTAELLAHEYGKLIVKSMRSEKAITKNPKPVRKAF